MSQFLTVKTKRIVAANNTTIQIVKATPGTLYGFGFYNTSAAETFIKLYDHADAVVGTTVPVMTIGINTNTHRDLVLPFPMWFGTGICVGITTLIADTDTTAPAALDVTGAVWYL
jgi:hypothetical protein